MRTPRHTAALSRRVLTMVPWALALVAAALGTAACASGQADAVSSATMAPTVETRSTPVVRTKALLFLVGSPSGSTAKIAGAIAEELGATIVGTDRADLLESDDSVLVGFGSGIFHGEHHPALLAMADELPAGRHRKVFLFSTCGIPASLSSPERLADAINRYHAALRVKLAARGCEVVGEFGCPGFNDNRFLKLVGGLNRGRPNAADLGRARGFARQLRAALELP